MAQGHRRYDGSRTSAAPVRVGAVAVLLVVAVAVARARGVGLAGPVRAVVIDLLGAVCLAVLVVGLVLLGWAGWVRGVPAVGAGRPPRMSPRRRVLVAAVAVVLVILLFAVARAPRPAPPEPWPVGGWLAAVGLIAAVGLLVLVPRRRPESRTRSRPDAGPAPAEAVAGAVEAGHAAVLDPATGDPRRAIVACFAAMEGALAGLGGELAPTAADTAAEVVARALAGAPVPEAPARALLELFREARYSAHPMRAADRDAAAEALAAIHTALAGAR